MKISILGLFLLVLGADIGFAQERPDTYDVVEIRGQPKVQDAPLTEWRSLQVGDEVGIGALLFLDAKSKLSLRYHPGLDGFSRVNLSGPTTTLVTLDWHKSHRFEDTFVTSGAIAKAVLAEKNDVAKYKESDSRLQWVVDRMRVFYESMVLGPKNLAAKDRHHSSSHLTRNKKLLEFIYPAHGMVLHSRQKPAKILFKWHGDLVADVHYKLFVWDAKKQPTEETIATDRTDEKVILAANGEYFAKVVAADGSAESKTIAFRLTFADDQKLAEHNAIEIQYPKDDSVFISSKNKLEIPIEISTGEGLEGVQIVVQSTGWDVVAKHEILSSNKIFLDGSGIHYWWLESAAGLPLTSKQKVTLSPSLLTNQSGAAYFWQ
jgi:hypothetical protein